MSLKGFFVNEHHDTVATHSAPKAITSTPQPSVPAPIGQIDAPSADQFSQHFRDVMDKANLPGPDYYEFAKALDTMKNSGLTDQQKFLAVFSGFAAQGLTADKLVDAANQYIGILNKVRDNDFVSSVDAATKQITDMQAEHDRLVKENEDLAKKMQDNNAKSSSLQGTIIQLQGKLESQKTTFTMSFNNFIQKIQEDIEHIKNYLLNGNTTK